MKKVIFGFICGFLFAAYWEGTNVFVSKYSPFPNKKIEISKNDVMEKAVKTKDFIKNEIIK